MEGQTLRKLKWFWAWQDEQEEQWLGQMSQTGWHLEAVELFGLYTFRQGLPRHYVYRLDFLSNRKDYAHYLQLFGDAGWQHLAEYGNWQYFRTEAHPGEAPEIFTDNTSKVEKYRRVALFLLIFVFPLFFFCLNLLRRWVGSAALTPEDAGFYGVIGGIYFGFFLIFVYALFKLVWRIWQLKRQGP